MLVSGIAQSGQNMALSRLAIFAYWQVSYLDLLRLKLAFEDEQAVLKLTLAETLKTGFRCFGVAAI